MSTFPTFPAADPSHPFATLIGFANVPVSSTTRVHAFVSHAYSEANTGAYLETLCSAFWHFHDAERVAYLSTNESAFLAVASGQVCTDCKTQYQRLRASGIPAPLPGTVQAAALGGTV